MCFGCWITKATNTHSEYAILAAFQQQKLVLRTRLNITFIRSMPVLFMITHLVPLHDVAVGVWCAMSAGRIIGLFSSPGTINLYHFVTRFLT